MKVEVFNWEEIRNADFVIDKSNFLKAYEIVFADIEDKVNIIFVNESKIQKLNNEYRQKDASTDVLSFNIDSNGVLGEVYVSLDYLKGEARLNIEEVVRMIVHGTLHLMGFDHKGYFEFNENSMGDSIGIANKWSTGVEEIFIEQEKRLKRLLAILDDKFVVKN